MHLVVLLLEAHIQLHLHIVNKWNGKKWIYFKTKVSPLIEGQSPDFVQADHATFIKFVRDYYKFLESGELTLSGTINNLAQETDTSNYILTESGDRIVDEASTIVFTSGETITGATSKATATVLVSDVSGGTKRLFISAQQNLKLVKRLQVEHLVLKEQLLSIVEIQYKTFNNF